MGKRDLPAHAGLAFEAVREPSVLAGGLPQPGSRDASSMPIPARSQCWKALRVGASATCMLTAVDTMKKGKGCIVNARFARWLLSRLPALVRPFTAFEG